MRTEYLKSAFLYTFLAFSIAIIVVSLLQYHVLAAPSQSYDIQLEQRDFIGLLPAQSWDASVTATFSGLGDYAVFGVSPDASSGFDNNDIPVPPPPPGSPYLQVYFYYPGQTPDELRYSRLAPDNSLEWPLRIECAGNTDNITLTWNVENIPSDYSVLLYQGENLIADMRAKYNYTFSASSGYYDFNIVSQISPPGPSYGVDVSISPSSQSGSNGATLNYTVTVSNTGNVSDTYDITVGDNASPSWGPTVLPTSLTLGTGVNRTLTLSVTIPSNATVGTIDKIWVQATSQDNAAVFDNKSCTAQVTQGGPTPPPGPSYGVNVLISPPSQSGSNGTTLKYIVAVSNTGNVSDTYTLENTDNAGWVKSLSSASLTVPGNSSDVVTLSVTIPANAQDGAWDNITVKATSKTDNTITDKDSCAAYAIQGVVGVQISITPENQSGAPGSTLSYTVKVTNGSNGQDNFDLSVSGGAGWNPQISPSSLTLAAGASGNSTLSVTVPGEASGGSSVGIAVTATSRANPAVSASASCIARAAVVRGVRLSISPSEGSGSPGATLKYTITISNTGNVVDNYDLSVTDNAGWNLKLSSSILTISIKGLEKIVLDVTIPGNAKLGTSDNIAVTARSRADPTKSDSASCRAIATGPSAISLAVPLIAIAIIIILTGGYLLIKFMGKGGRKRRVLSAHTLYSFMEAKIED
jgi:uncharacterized membrane protein